MARLACGVRAAADGLALFNAWAGDGTWDKVLIAIQGEQHAPTFNGNRDNLPEGATVSWVRERTRGWQ